MVIQLGLVIPGLYNLSNSVENQFLQMGLIILGVRSLFASLSLGYKDMFFLEATGRNDWFLNVK